MKRMLLTLLLLSLAGACLLTPVTASAYWDVSQQLALTDDELPTLYGTLKQRMATRTGPATDYPEPGTFLSKGDKVRIISLAFDENDVPWVQVDLTYGKKHIRAYTGLKRFADVDADDIPRELNDQIEVKLKEKVTPRYGPGTNYTAYSFTLKAGYTVSVIDFENGYAMCDFYSKSDGEWNRVWIPESSLNL